ncbi:MAG TPA: transposase [Actinocrinis sp.]|uniref:transposase n=1 Tax=Actinocrinis sp. TaxID=1920516 RepID=UPI002DDDA81B|nr:transposase [Actinocrinis sp.]HEV3171096.1 transposase [Actinocrinis sp.]
MRSSAVSPTKAGPPQQPDTVRPLPNHLTTHRAPYIRAHRFRTAGHLASWAGTTPGHRESAGRRKPAATRHGNCWLAATLGTTALAASRTKDTYLGTRYRRLIARTGKKKALVALQHSILIAVWHMLTHNVAYHDLGPAHFDQLNPERAKHRALAQLHRLGYHVALTPAA